MLSSADLGRPTVPRRKTKYRRLASLAIFSFLAFAAGYLCQLWIFGAPVRPSERARAMRFADEAVRWAYEENWRDAFLAAGRARYHDASLPGMEILVGQMLVNNGQASAASQYARAAQRRGDSLAHASLLLGLDAWSRRGWDARQFTRAATSSELWLGHAAAEAPSDGAPRFFLAEVARMAGVGSEHIMERALHRFGPWESSLVIGAKIHLASSEAGGVFNAMNLGASLRLDESPQARAIRGLRRSLLAGKKSDEAERQFLASFTSHQAELLLDDPALAESWLSK